MNQSIQGKLFKSIGLLIIAFVLLSWALNRWCLEKYYIFQKKSTLIESSQAIDKIYKGNPKNIALALEKLESTTGASIIIAGKDNEIKYNSISRMLNHKLFHPGPLPGIDIDADDTDRGKFEGKPGFLPGRDDVVPPRHGPQGPRHNKIKFHRVIKGKYVLEIQNDLDLMVNFLLLRTTLRNGDKLILRAPMAAISESVGVANNFMVFTGLLIMLLGSVWAFVFAKRFTQPILELNSVARSMARLDFSKKYNIQSDDEVGELGKSINHLSTQLDLAIAELYEKNQKLLEDIERERKIDEMRKEFVSSVSHELKTPIALIQGYAEGLKENVIADEESKEFYCDVIMDESRKMDKLVKDLLNLSQIESGYFHLERTNFDIANLVEQVVNKYRAILDEKGISLVMEKGDNIDVNGDQIRIEQVLVNYINNAINHIDGEKLIKISVAAEKEKVRVFVYNSGKPIPEASLKEIWKSFYKVDKARTRAYGGYGLGLSIVRAIQELHHNDFGVENVDDGVRFWFDIDLVSK